MSKSNIFSKPNHILPASTLKYLFIGWTVFLILLFSVSFVNSQVSGRYIAASGKQLVLSLDVSKPTPNSLIVVQTTSPSNRVTKTAPKAKKIARKSGQIKWLFRNPSPGSLTITTILQSPLQGRVSAIVRYRDPQSGHFTETVISN